MIEKCGHNTAMDNPGSILVIRPDGKADLNIIFFPVFKLDAQ
jgi:hypothetical protein